MKNYIFLLVLYTSATSLFSQNIDGYIIEEINNTNKYISGAVVIVKNSSVGATTNDSGYFLLQANPDTDTILVSSLGYITDTVPLRGNKRITVSLTPLILEEVEITAKQATRIEMSARNTELINSGDLVKDACCNLSESFENTATVDFSYSDAVSGAKEIRMLGLDGNYTQIMIENIPSIRSLGNTFGMNYIPGPLMSSIQINKGAGSVINGYEGMTGQINVELKKPQVSDKLYVNLFLNQDLRSELNLISAIKINKNWSTLSSVHSQYNWLRMDLNKDHYIDNPLVKNLNLLHRVTYTMNNGGMVLFGAIANIEDRVGGSYHFKPKDDYVTQNAWGLRLRTNRVELFAKTGFAMKNDDYIGIQYKYIYHEQYGNIGRRYYSGEENYGYLNVIYQKTIPGVDNLIKAGFSFQTDDVRERFDTFNRKRLELVPGVFGEMNMNFGTDKKVMLVAGARLDYHNMFGPFASPRVNIKWNIIYDLSLRASVGRGYRVPTLFAENFSYLANNRQIQFSDNIAYEEAWNYGASINYKFFLGFREGNINVDYYRTDFVRQVVADLEDVRLLRFYNMPGKSFANAFQIDISYEVVKGLDAKLAYKFEQSKTDYLDGRKILPLRPQHRGLVSLQYTTRKKHWRFNTSLNWFGKTRIPSTMGNDEQNQRALRSKDYFQLNAQITYAIKRWEVYVGGENLANFIQKNPIISGDQPFSNQFDASLIWGPLRGAMVFAGFRYILP